MEVVSIARMLMVLHCIPLQYSQGGKNRRRGKNENEDEKRELIFKEEGQGG